MPWTPVSASASTWDATHATRGAGQFVTLAPVDLTGGDVDFCVKVDDKTPLYVYDPAPLHVVPTASEQP